MHKRTLYFKIAPYLEHKNAIVITGMRQVGKTTLMKQLSEAWKGKFAWFDFDNPLDYLLFENIDYNLIYNELKNIVHAKNGERFLICIDEIQNFPEITKIIKYLIDHYNVKFIVTGSSNFYLRNLFPESLSGRKFLFILNPLSYKEYLHFNGLLLESQLDNTINEALPDHRLFENKKRSALYKTYMEFGGFPEVAITKDNETKSLILKNIFTSFFEKDIKVFTELKDVKELRNLILLLGARNGKIIDVTRLASELGIHRVKVYNYLEFLEGIFFIRLVPKYSKSIDRSVAGGKKVYFSDSGILNYITSPGAGQLLETTVANQLANHGSLAFYNKRNTAEIDFILNNEIAIEVKQKAIAADLNKLRNLSNRLNIHQYFMVSNTIVDLPHVVYPWFL